MMCALKIFGVPLRRLLDLVVLMCEHLALVPFDLKHHLVETLIAGVKVHIALSEV